MLKVFLSSTSLDLKPEREAVEAAIQRLAAQYVGMEYFGSFAEDPLERSLKQVRSANVLILVLGDKYGFVPKGSSISITEAEFREALRKKIPVLTYLIKHESWAITPADTPKLKRLKKELETKHGVTWFTSPDDLAWKVICDLAREFSGLLSPEKPSLETVQNRLLLDPIKDRLDELVGILENRARKIQRDLAEYYEYAPVKKYLREFGALHKKHVRSLREGKLLQAHELLFEIHKLSAALKREEFKGYRRKRVAVKYRIDFDLFERDRLICEYIAGEMEPLSTKYRLDEGFWDTDEGLQANVPTISLALYEKILSMK